MKLSRPTLALALSSALFLSACSGDGEVVEPTSGSSAAGASQASADGADGTTAADAATATTGEDAGATSDGTDVAGSTDAAGSTDVAAGTGGAGGTDDAAGTTVAMTADEDRAALPLAEAEEAARTILTARMKADQGDGREIRDLQRASLMESARTAHEAADRLESVTGEPAEVDLEENPVEPNVLAISREDGELPMFLLVQTVPEEGLPVLHLLESRTGETKDFRISWEAPMLPGTEVPTFDARSVGTPVLRSGKGDLQIAPRDLLKQLAVLVTYPTQEDLPDFRTHDYAPSVRRAAQEQAEAVGGRATLQEKNWLVSDDTKTLLFEDGSAFVMGTLLRDTQFRVVDGNALSPSDSFRVFQDSGTLENEAVLRTSVFVGMRAGTEENPFKPEMIAAREQLVDAWGS
ncbi:hypothetical protein [Ornithinimicrobium flavum]|uniref:hypothetical protein n=1 Tax=Ornithinimicrobium flavum TaxID=1288636 RepID=UPI00106F324C|nr:hypothetical protein [Ornithinimicrobium flavum]